MPTIRFVERYPLPPAVVFAFFRRPADVVAVAPPDFEIRLVEGPRTPDVGERFAVEVRRFGLARRIDTEVTAVEEPSLLTERQVQGPFREWVLERRFVAADGGGTELTETITYETPGGLLGVMMTPATVEAELKRAYEGRPDRVIARISSRKSDAARP